MQKTIMVTGGAGFIGSNFIRHWLKNYPDNRIINFDALTYAGNLSSLKDIESLPNYRFVKGDIRKVEQVEPIVAESDLVVHFAAESHVDRSILGPQEFIQTNVVGTQVLLDCAVKTKLKHFHHVSTDEVFGSLELESSEKFDESRRYDPRSPYSASKAASDHLVRAYGDTYGLNYTLTNCSNNYGEYHFPEKFIPLAITQVLEGKKVPVYGDGLNVRDWLYVQDHCRAIDLVINHGKSQQTYLVGGMSHDVSNLELIKLTLKLMGKSEDMIEYVKDRPGHDRRYAVNWSHINSTLGWKPSVSLEEGLTKTIAWYSNNESWWKPLKTKAQEFFTQNYKTI